MNWNFKNFSEKEFACQHCGKNGIEYEFVEKLQQLRDEFGKPIKINSGYRCPEHPIESAKKTTGTHCEGYAVDIAVDREDAYKLLGLALQLEFTGIGIKQKGDNRFIHLDTSKVKNPRPTIWSY